MSAERWLGKGERLDRNVYLKIEEIASYNRVTLSSGQGRWPGTWRFENGDCRLCSARCKLPRQGTTVQPIVTGRCELQLVEIDSESWTA